MDDWLEKADDKDLRKILKHEELFEILERAIAFQVERMKQDALTDAPTESARADANRSGYRHGKYVGLSDVLALYGRSKETLEQRELDSLDKEKE